MKTIAFVGLFSVFFVFFLLYSVVILLEKFLRRKARTVATPVEKRVSEEEISPETVAVITAVLAQFMGEGYRIVSIKCVRPKDGSFETWEKTGWRGRRRWSEGSGWL